MVVKGVFHIKLMECVLWGRLSGSVITAEEMAFVLVAEVVEVVIS